MRRRADTIFKWLEMDGFRDRRCDKLSTGMKQKVSIARTLVHDPPVMIFDEPTSGLDVMTARTIVSFIRECRQQGKTVIFSTHVMSEVEKLCVSAELIVSHCGGRLSHPHRLCANRKNQKERAGVEGRFLGGQAGRWADGQKDNEGEQPPARPPVRPPVRKVSPHR